MNIYLIPYAQINRSLCHTMNNFHAFMTKISF